MANSSSTPTAVVQHVTKASSDRLLSKFAELETKAPRDDSTSSSSRKLQLVLKAPAAAAGLRRKRTRRVAAGLGARDLAAASECAASSSSRRRRRMSGGAAAEWKSLLPPSSQQADSALSRTGEAAGIALLFAAMQKTWRKTVKGASRMFIEKHCNITTHVRLISEVA